MCRRPGIESLLADRGLLGEPFAQSSHAGQKRFGFPCIELTYATEQGFPDRGNAAHLED